MSTQFVGLRTALRTASIRSNAVMRKQVSLRSAVLRRNIQTQSLKPEQAENVLNAQRVLRPSSPHFTIYQPQLTWIASIANRVTGGGLSVLLYGFSISYVVFPFIGLPFGGFDVVSFVAGLPEGVKLAGKAILAAPFSFHVWNGFRHLAWDATKFMSIKGVYNTGYAVLGATAVSTVGLMFI